jgi:hypothetical protein
MTRNFALIAIIAIVSTGCATRVATPTTPVAQTPEVTVEVGTVNMVAQINEQDVILPAGWDLLSSENGEVVAAHEDFGVLTVRERTQEEANASTMSVTDNEGEMWFAAAPHEDSRHVALDNGTSTDEGIAFRVVSEMTERHWYVGNYVVTLTTDRPRNIETATSLVRAALHPQLASR